MLLNIVTCPFRSLTMYHNTLMGYRGLWSRISLIVKCFGPMTSNINTGRFTSRSSPMFMLKWKTCICLPTNVFSPFKQIQILRLFHCQISGIFHEYGQNYKRVKRSKAQECTGLYLYQILFLALVVQSLKTLEFI